MNWSRLPGNEPPWSSTLSWVAALMGASTGVATMSSSPLIIDGLKILVLGSVIETGRRIFQWIVDRFEFRYAVSAEFQSGDSSYEWLVNYLMTEQVWQTPRTIYVKSKSSQRKWKFPSDTENGQVDYVPNFGAVQFFRWKGYWLDVSRLQAGVPYEPHMGEFEQSLPDGPPPSTSIALSIYTRDMSVLFAFVEECRLKYLENTKTSIMIYAIDTAPYYNDDECWTNVKTKRRRSLDTLLLDEGVIGSLLADAREFMRTEDWYIRTGIPHRRGYLLYGAPGTGKTSTVYTIAGELGLEIYALSLSSSGMNDDGLGRIVSSLPPKAILLIEDIDCAFPSREELDERIRQSQYAPFQVARSQVTLSGLLNVLDGIGSDEGKLFFATTNHIDRLDPALMRPGRIDRKIEYKLASRRQAHGLFMKFFPKLNLKPENLSSNHPKAKEHPKVSELAEEFARAIPENTFSMAELQGYLLDWKQDASGAIHGIGAWVENERISQQERAAREKLRREKAAAVKPQQHDTAYGPIVAGEGSGSVVNSGSQSKLASPLITSSDKTSDVDSEDETQISDTESAYQARTTSLGPSKVVKVSPQSESPIVASDVVVSSTAL